MNSNSDKEYIDARVDGIRAVLDERTEAIRDSMEAMRVAVEAKIDSAFERAVSQFVKWMVGTLLAGITIVISVMTFVLNNAIPKAQPAAPVAPAVIIQVTPQGVSVLPVTPAAPSPKP
ncbi:MULTISPECIES: hypothetical protein [unclassified Duganella]|uniref:hypothetical protein n=1 Tax=unclassified Duganella TaxID=2636909 RepID=UPI000E3570D0|nr:MULTISPECIES: hypothetical protein [unclassified Duganella]RFP18598.1 hypothetical protein D0T23_01980 [Duganella sp. BJB475]RFP35263.1 hypothetical protein D0T21_01980 [Duganella sp. BJB476]